MIIPIRCFTCNNMIASKYEKYKILTAASADEEDLLSTLTDPDNNQINKIIDKTHKLFLEDLGIKRYCCKRHLLTHVDLIEKI